MNKYTSDLNDSSRSTIPPELGLHPSNINVYNNLQARHSIDVGSFARSSTSKTKSKQNKKDRSKPCKLNQVISDAITSFNTQNDTKVRPKSSKFWIITRDSYDCATSDTRQKDNIYKSVSFESLPLKKCVNEVKHEKMVKQDLCTANVAGTISEQTRNLIDRSKTLDEMIEYTKPKPKRKKSNIFRDLLLPMAITRSSSANCINDDSNMGNVNILRRPQSAVCLHSNNDNICEKRQVCIRSNLKISPETRHRSRSDVPYRDIHIPNAIQRSISDVCPGDHS